MKIHLTKAMEAFFERCLYNMQNDEINDYIGLLAQPQEELQFQEELRAMQVLEFQGDPDTWPSLYIDTKVFCQSPYHTAISLRNVSQQGFSYRMDTMPAWELFNVGTIQPDPNRELHDSLMLRAFDKPYETTVLLQDGAYWMSDTPQEANTIDPYAAKAHGKILTFGLGIGYFVFMALMNPEVKSVTIVEQSEDVIAMFKKDLLPQFPRANCIHILQGDAFHYFTEAFLKDYDYIFADIWKSNEDGYQMIEQMLEQYNPSLSQIDFWIEDTCFDFMSGMILMYFMHLAHHQPITHTDPFYQRIYHKIDRYFQVLDVETDQIDVLKQYMYDKEVKRAIAALIVT